MNITDKTYELLTDDDRSCDAIPESACKQAPGNFLLNASNGSLTKLAEQIASPSLVLPWFLSALGVPSSLSGLLVPIHKGGSLFPQLIVSGKIRAFNIRKWFWVGAGLTQALALFLMGVTGLLTDGLTAGILILLLLLIFSIASGVGSVSFKDVLAKTIPKGERGTLLSVRAMVGGALALLAGVFINRYIGEGEDVSLYVLLVGVAGILWFFAALLFAMIKEEKGATEGGRSAFNEAVNGYKVLKKQKYFTRFIIVRSLLLSVMLVVPFYSIFARDVVSTEISSLGLFMITNSLAMVLSSYVWGRLADKSSHKAMAYGGLLGFFSALVAVMFTFFPESWQSPLLYSSVFLFAGFAHAGVRLGRKTYLIDAAPEKERPLYVAVSNTLVGIVTIASGLFGIFADLLGVNWLIGIFALMMVSGSILSLTLPKPSKMVIE